MRGRRRKSVGDVQITKIQEGSSFRHRKTSIDTQLSTPRFNPASTSMANEPESDAGRTTQTPHVHSRIRKSVGVVQITKANKMEEGSKFQRETTSAQLSIPGSPRYDPANAFTESPFQSDADLTLTLPRPVQFQYVTYYSTKISSHALTLSLTFSQCFLQVSQSRVLLISLGRGMG